jgi:chaperonin GroES
MRVKPRNTHILIKPEIPNYERKIGHIVVPATATLGNTGFYATVVAIGPGKLLKDGTFLPLQVTLGDRVLLSKWAGTRLFVDGQPYMIIDESEVLGVV